MIIVGKFRENKKEKAKKSKKHSRKKSFLSLNHEVNKIKI
jgi:hypothetical protein